MSGYDSYGLQHKVLGIELMCPFVEKLLKKVSSRPKSAQKNCPVMPEVKGKPREVTFT